MIFVENKKKKKGTLATLYPNAEVIDVTSNGIEPFVRLSPFYPHGDIPVPFSQNIFSFSVEGIWQGLKVFEKTDIDVSKFEIQSMKGLKRTIKKFGKPLGHRKGVAGTQLLDYLSARKQIYLPTYAWVLQNKTISEIENLVEIALSRDIVLLDFETNADIENIKKPLSHAALIKKFIDKKYPELTEKRFSEALSTKSREGYDKKQGANSKIKPQKEKLNKNAINDIQQMTLDL